MNHLIPEFETWRKRYPEGFESSLVIPCCRRIQEDRGFVADSDIDELVEYLGVPRIQVEEVLAFYTQFRRRPIGKWHVQLCHNVSCSMRGSEGLLTHLETKLGVAPGVTTADNSFTLSTVECLGSCGTAPMMMLNDSFYEISTPPSSTLFWPLRRRMNSTPSPHLRRALLRQSWRVRCHGEQNQTIRRF